jgi:hypothetical protein
MNKVMLSKRSLLLVVDFQSRLMPVIHEAANPLPNQQSFEEGVPEPIAMRQRPSGRNS